MTNLLKKIGLIAGLTLLGFSCSDYQKESQKVTYEKIDTTINYIPCPKEIHGRGIYVYNLKENSDLAANKIDTKEQNYKLFHVGEECKYKKCIYNLQEENRIMQPE